MTAPERIWISEPSKSAFEPADYNPGTWTPRPDWCFRHPYILATPEALAASPEVQALVMAERERCAGICSESAIMTRYYDEGAGDGPNTRAEVAEDLAAAIRAGTEGGE